MRLLWHLIRFPALAVLGVLFPLASFVLLGAALLAFLTAFFFEFLTLLDFPFWGTIAFGVACALLHQLYCTVLRLLSR